MLFTHTLTAIKIPCPWSAPPQSLPHRTTPRLQLLGKAPAGIVADLQIQNQILDGLPSGYVKIAIENGQL